LAISSVDLPFIYSSATIILRAGSFPPTTSIWSICSLEKEKAEGFLLSASSIRLICSASERNRFRLIHKMLIQKAVIIALVTGLNGKVLVPANLPGSFITHDFRLCLIGGSDT